MDLRCSAERAYPLERLPGSIVFTNMRRRGEVQSGDRLPISRITVEQYEITGRKSASIR
jgi:hypothetical protein